LVCVIAASLTIAIMDRMRTSSARRSPFDPASTVALHLHEAKGYGNATLRINDGTAQPLPSNTAAVVEAIQRAIRDANCNGVLLRVSGGVRQSEVQRLQNAVVRAAEGRGINIYVVLADEQPEIFEPSDLDPSSREES
jgi:hypothetical protein